MTLHFLSKRSDADRRIALLISVAVLVGVPLLAISAATDDRARIRQAVVGGKSEDLRTLLQLPAVRPLIAKTDDNDFLYLAVEQVFPYRFNGYDASPEELERSRSVDARQAEVIKILLENGATASVNGAKPRPPALIHAVRLRATQCVKALLNAGANPNITDNGYRPLPMAARNGASRIVMSVFCGPYFMKNSAAVTRSVTPRSISIAFTASARSRSEIGVAS